MLRFFLITAFRKRLKKPGFLIATMLMLGISIGWLGALFGVFESLFLKPLPVFESERLVRIFNQDQGRVSYPNFLSYREQCETLESFSAFWTDSGLIWEEDGVASFLRGTFVSESFFDTVQTPMTMGVPFGNDDRSNVIVLSYRFWKTQLSGRSDVIERQLRINKQVFTVIGVAGEGFDGMIRGRRVDMWLPVRKIWISKPPYFTESRGHHAFNMVGRLESGMSISQANVELTGIARRVSEAFPKYAIEDETKLTVVSESRAAITRNEESFRFYVLLFVISGLLLLIAAGNITNLLLSNILQRESEFAIRNCLGARRSHLLLQFFLEGLILAIAGVLLGLFLLFVGVRYIAPALGFADVHLDFSLVWLICSVLAFLTIVVSLVPYLYSRQLNFVLAANQSRSGSLNTRGSAILVYLQVALTTVLLVISLLFVKSLRQALQADFGFNTDQMVMMNISVKGKDWKTPQSWEFYRQLKRHMEGLNGVESVGVAVGLPLYGGGWLPVYKEDLTDSKDSKTNSLVQQIRIGPDYFKTMEIPLLKGRYTTFDDHYMTEYVKDHPGPLPVIVNESFVRKYYPDEDPVNQVFYKDSQRRAVVIVGVVRDFKTDLRDKPIPTFFIPYYKYAVNDRFLVFHVRGDMNSRVLLDIVRNEKEQMDASVPVGYLNTIEGHLGDVLEEMRIGSVVIGLLAGIGLILSGLGIWALFAANLNHRRKEVAIRISLGATYRGLFLWLVSRSFKQILIGFILGVIILVAGFPYMTRADLFYETPVFSSEIYVVVLALFLLITLLCTLLSLLRIQKWDVSDLLKGE